MQIAATAHGQEILLNLIGRFDFSAHREFRSCYKEALDNPAFRTITLDFAKVEYMDSAALGMLLLLREGAANANKTVVLRGAAGAVQKVLEIANFGKLFTLR